MSRRIMTVEMFSPRNVALPFLFLLELLNLCLEFGETAVVEFDFEGTRWSRRQPEYSAGICRDKDFRMTKRSDHSTGETADTLARILKNEYRPHISKPECRLGIFVVGKRIHLDSAVLAADENVQAVVELLHRGYRFDKARIELQKHFALLREAPHGVSICNEDFISQRAGSAAEAHSSDPWTRQRLEGELQFSLLHSWKKLKIIEQGFWNISSPVLSSVIERLSKASSS